MTTTDIKENRIIWDDFYKHLGYLYFGIAAELGAVNEDRMAMLRKSAQRIWQKNSGVLEGFEGYTVNKMDSLYDWLALNETSPEYCFDEFSVYFKQVKPWVSDALKNFIMNSAQEIHDLMGKQDSVGMTKLNSWLS